MKLNRTKIGLACELLGAESFQIELDLDGNVVVRFIKNVNGYRGLVRTDDAAIYEETL